METKQVSTGCSDYIGVQEFIPAWCRASSAALDLGLASLLKGCVLWAVQWDWLRRLKSTNGSTGFFHTGRQRKPDLLTRRKIIQTNSSGTHLGWFPGQLACSDECSSLASAGQERKSKAGVTRARWGMWKEPEVVTGVWQLEVGKKNLVSGWVTLPNVPLFSEYDLEKTSGLLGETKGWTDHLCGFMHQASNEGKCRESVYNIRVTHMFLLSSEHGTPGWIDDWLYFVLALWPPKFLFFPLPLFSARSDHTYDAYGVPWPSCSWH